MDALTGVSRAPLTPDEEAEENKCAPAPSLARAAATQGGPRAAALRRIRVAKRRERRKAAVAQSGGRCGRREGAPASCAV